MDPVTPKVTELTRALDETGINAPPPPSAAGEPFDLSLLDADDQASLQRIVENGRLLLGASVAALTLRDGDRTTIIASSPPIEEGPEPIPDAVCHHIMSRGDNLVIRDMRAHPFRDELPASLTTGLVAYLGTPVCAPDASGTEQVVASLCVSAIEPRDWTERDLVTLRTLGEGVSSRLCLVEALAKAKGGQQRAEGREAELERFFASVPQPIIMWRPGGEVIYVSPQVKESIGVSQEALMGFSWVDRIHPDDLAMMRERSQSDHLEAEEEGPPYRIRDDAEGYRHVVSRTLASVDGLGNPRLISSLTDVSEMIRAEERVQAERRAGEHQIRQLLNALPIFCGLISPDGKLQIVNDAPVRAIGTSPEEVLSKSVWESLWVQEDPKAQADLRQIIEDAATGKEIVRPLSITWQGKNLDMMYYASPMWDEAGNITGIAASAVDITEQNQIRHELESQRDQLRQILEGLPILLSLTDVEGRLLFVNQALLELTGLSEESVIGQCCWDVPWSTSPDLPEKVREGVEAAASGKVTRLELSLDLPTGTRDFEIYYGPIYDKAGNVESVLNYATDVSSARILEQRAADEVSRLRDALNGMTTAVGLYDAEGKFLTGNAAAFELHGVDVNGLVGRLLTDLPRFDSFAENIQEMLAIARSGRKAHFAFALEIEDEMHEFASTLSPIRDQDGTLRFFLFEVLDQTEPVHLLADLESERKRLQVVIEALPVGLLIFDKEMNVLLANDGARHLALDVLDDFHRGTYIEANGEETAIDEAETPIRRALRGEDGHESRTMHLWKEGSPEETHRYLNIEAAPILDSQGAVTSAVMTVTNVKHLREAEQALSRERLAGAERIQALMEAMPIFVGLCDPAGDLLYANLPPLKALNLSLKEIEGKPIWETLWFADSPEQAARMKEGVRIAQAGRPFRSEFQVQSPEGLRELEISMIPILSNEGVLRFLLPSGVDVTERNLAQRALEASTAAARDAQTSAERAKEAAEQATMAKDQFLSVLSHELRTPLTPAMLGLELMAADLDLITKTRTVDDDTLESIRETFASVRGNLDLQVRLIDDLLDITRISRGKLELQLQPTDANEAARDAVSITAGEAAERKVVVTLDLRADRSIVNADPARLRQILWNLLTNAIKFTPIGGTVTVRTANPSPRSIVISVQDSGRGIERDKTEAIFNAFEQGGVGVTRAFGGLGLGLAISRSLAIAHGATLIARSEGIDKGATFDLTMSLSEAEAEVGSVAAPPIRGADQKAPRVLLVEDNQDTARMTAELLRRSGATVVIATSVAEAVERCKEAKELDALVSDLGLPDGTGYDVIRRVHEECGNLPAIAFSGFGTDEDRRRVREAGFRTLLVKPIDFESLRAALALALA